MGRKIRQTKKEKKEEEEIMEDLTIITKTQKVLKERLQHIGDSILTGGVDNMEKYKYLVGQAHAIQLTLQDISNLLKPKEQEDEQGNVIDIGNANGKGSTKN
jgi:protein subunit release factor A